VREHAADHERAVPRHLAVIPDGNRRYAHKHALSYADGYLAGARMALQVVHWCLGVGIEHLSGFGSSVDNLTHRPPEDGRAIRAAVDWFCREARSVPGVSLTVFGEPEGSAGLVTGDDRTPDGPASGGLVVHVARWYSGHRDLAAVAAAVPHCGGETVVREPERFLLSAALPPVDLLLRTGGQRRLSGFLPLQTAYAELYFLDTLWADLTADEFRGALRWFAAQERRFGE
jgi:short-chain Z-isoprenyl diphosphate synthase